MALLLVFGPSGVGKSTLCSQLYASRDLDTLVKLYAGERSAATLLCKTGSDAFFDLCQASCSRLSHLSETFIIAIGAGTLLSPRVAEWFKDYPTIVIMAPPEEVYKRGGDRNRQRTLVEFRQTEYSPYRMQLYDLANHKFIADGLSLQQAKKQFIQFLRDTR